MDQLIQWLIAGVPIGCVYALVAVGLVLTYKTSGVFNLAFSGQAFLSGAVFYVLVENNGMGLFWAFFLAVFVVSPLFGTASMNACKPPSTSATSTAPNQSIFTAPSRGRWKFGKCAQMK